MGSVSSKNAELWWRKREGGGGYSMNYLRPPGLPNVKLRILKTCGNYIKIGELWRMLIALEISEFNFTVS